MQITSILGTVLMDVLSVNEAFELDLALADAGCLVPV